MSKTCKKLLASALAATMLISTFVSSLVVSAATIGTLGIASEAIVEGTTEAKVDLTFTYTAAGGVEAPHKFITLTSEFALKDVVLKSVNGSSDYGTKFDGEGDDKVCTNPWPAYIEADGADFANGKFLIETDVQNPVKFTELVLTATYTIPAETVAGSYAVTANASATDYEETDYDALEATGNIVINAKAPEVVHSAVADWTSNETHHWHACSVADCEETFDYAEHSYVDGICECGAEEPVVEPELDSSIVFADTYANLGATLGINFEFSVPTGYDSAYVEIDRKKCNSSYDFDDAPTRVFDSRTMEGSNGIYTITYDGIALYETTIPARAVIYLVKNDVAVKKSDVIEISLATLIKNRFANAGTKSKALYADILKIGTAAQDYFIAIAKRNGNQTPDLEGVALPTDGISVDAYGATSYSLATEINLDDTGVLSAYIGLDPAPGLIFDVTIPSGYSAEDLTLVSTYTSNVLGETPDSVKLSDITPNNSVYTVPFSKIALYDSNKLATASLVYKAGTDEEAVIATTGCSVESYLGTRISSAGTKSKVLYEAIAKLGVSARDYFSALYKITV